MESLVIEPTPLNIADCDPPVFATEASPFETLLNQKLKDSEEQLGGQTDDPELLDDEASLETPEYHVQTHQLQPVADVDATPITPHTDHEVVENLMTQMVEDGQLTQDEDGRRVMLMRLNVPGRGDVRVRMWHKPEGLDLKLKATDASTERLLRTNADQLRQGLADRGVRLSKLEV